MSETQQPKAEVFYFDGCPSYARALANLREALQLEQLADDVVMIPVADEADAHAKRFVGSPTLRINGIDVEGPDVEERGYAFGCRVYADGTTMAGWPSVDLIRRALRRSSA